MAGGWLIRSITYSELKIIVIMMSTPEDQKKLWGTTLEHYIPYSSLSSFWISSSSPGFV